MPKIKILSVCNWPLGGIRTFLKYIYSRFPINEFDVTVLASPSVEKHYLENDMLSAGIKVVWAAPLMGRNTLALYAASLLLKQKYHIIHSQGFISAFHVATVNWLFRVPHVLTIHGILEKQYFAGRLEKLKRLLFGQAMRNVDVFHGVGHGILRHFRETFPHIGGKKTRWVVITNGIITAPFVESLPGAQEKLRAKLGIHDRKTIFGFFGRFMLQKGFNYIIDAVETLKNKPDINDFIIVAVGTGDYEREYKKEVESRNLGDYFKFIPFDPDVAGIMKGCDAVLMPSVWEAWGLVACESLAAGVPLIASDCIGLQEAIEHTPAIRIPPQDASALAGAMEQVLANPDLKNTFQEFKQEAARRFDVRQSALKLIELFRRLYINDVRNPARK